MVATSAVYRMIVRDLDRSLDTKAAEPKVALEAKYYLDNIGKVTSIDAFLKNTRLFKFAMSAFGLEDMAHAKGLMRKVLTDGVADSKAFANRVDDKRFLEFAKVFNFARDGAATTTKTDARQGTVDRYVRQALETSSGTESEGVRLALYFQRVAPTMTSFYGILADAALSEVVRTAFGIPKESAAADIDKQAAALDARFDIADLKDSKKLDRLITRFTAAWDAADTSSRAPVLTLFDAAPSPSLDLVMTLKNLKRGGA